MAVTQDRPAPYAPASAVLEIIKRYRNKGLPTPVTSDVLARAGISDSLLPRVLQALQTLDLIDDDGRPTQVLEGIRRAPEGEYQQRLRDWLTAAYADALAFIDPETADETAIRDAFRSYQPIGQQPRMVTLFSGLFQAAGVGKDKDKPLSAPRKSAGGAKPRPAAAAAKPRAQTAERTGGSGQMSINSGSLPPALAGLLASLPATGSGWTQDSRDRFVQTFAAVLDFCFPVREDDDQYGDADVEDAA